MSAPEGGAGFRAGGPTKKSIDADANHSPTAVPLEAEFIQRIALIVVRLEKLQIGFPFVTNHLRHISLRSLQSSLLGRPFEGGFLQTRLETARGSTHLSTSKASHGYDHSEFRWLMAICKARGSIKSSKKCRTQKKSVDGSDGDRRNGCTRVLPQRAVSDTSGRGEG